MLISDQLRKLIKIFLPYYNIFSDLRSIRIPISYIGLLYNLIFSQLYWYKPKTHYVGMPKRIYIGKNSNIGRDYNFFQAMGGIIIGNYCEFATRVSLLTSNHDLYNQNISHHKPIIIGDYCWLGMNSTILAGVTLGPRTIVANSAVVTKSFPEGFCVIAGVPAKIVKKLDPALFNPLDYKKGNEYYGFINSTKFENNIGKYAKKYLDMNIFKIVDGKIRLKNI